MPRNGSGIYSVPTGTAAVSGTPVASSPYNAFLADLVSDANAARPITAGGTGATDAATALSNLGGMATDADLAAIAALGYSAKSLLTKTAANTWTLTTISSNVESILGAADYAAVRTLLSLGTAALKATGTSGDAVPLLNAAALTFSGQINVGSGIASGAVAFHFENSTVTNNKLGVYFQAAGAAVSFVPFDGGSYSTSDEFGYDFTGNYWSFDSATVYVGGSQIVTRTASETLSNKTFSSPTLSGTVAGSPSLSGKFSFTSLSATAASGNAAVALGRSATNQFQGLAFTTGVAADGVIYRKASSDSIVLGFDLGGGLSDAFTLTSGGDPFITSVGPTSVYSLGYRGCPLNTQATDYTLVLADAGKLLYHQSASTHSYTIPPNSSVAFPIGTVIPILNPNGAGTLSIVEGSGVTLRRADGTAGTGTRTIAANSQAAIEKTDTNEWYITGSIS